MKKWLKGCWAVLMSLALLLSCCASAEEAPLALDEDAMFDYMVDEFEGIAQIPRGSGNTDAISDYLFAWGEEHGFASMQDEVGNVRWDVEATPGYEDVPLIVLQAHMDMVVVSGDGRDMTQSPIAVVVDEENNVITSDGHTSLGSDDGMGIVSIMYLVTTDEYAHGPLRVIITINEEGGEPSGVGNMDHSWVTDAKYLINIDSEDYATCTVAACGFMSYQFNVPLTSEAVDEGKIAYTIDLNGTKGGHSGVDIDKNRANAIKAVNYCLAWAKYNGIDVQIASFTGGTGSTAIPALASATIVFSPEYEEQFKAEMDQTIALFAQQYDRTEAGYSFTYAPAELPESALTADCSATVIDLVASLEEGVNTISQRYEGITETSFNMGTLDVAAGEESTAISLSMRCSTRWPVMLANMQFVAIGNAFGVEVTSWGEDPFNPENINVGWEEREGDTIALLYKQAFDSYTGDECVITAVHGGLECADFASWSEELEIISVGPTIENPHSVSEYVEIDTVTKTCGAVATLINSIANGVTIAE